MVEALSRLGKIVIGAVDQSIVAPVKTSFASVRNISNNVPKLIDGYAHHGLGISAEGLWAKSRDGKKATKKKLP